MMEAAFHSLVVFLVPFFIFEETILEDDAFNNDFWSFSVTSFTAVIFIVTLKLMVFERFFTWINFVAIFLLSVGLYLGYVWLGNYMEASNTFSSIQTIFSSPHFYLTVIVCTALAYAIDIFKTSYSFEIHEDPADYLRKRVSKEKPVDEQEFERLYEEVQKESVRLAIEREKLMEIQRAERIKKEEATPAQSIMLNRESLLNGNTKPLSPLTGPEDSDYVPSEGISLHLEIPPSLQMGMVLTDTDHEGRLA